jgi:autotransporter-associated beta strand protein
LKIYIIFPYKTYMKLNTMKPTSTLRSFLTLAGTSLLAIPSAFAVDYTWGGGNLFWNDTTASGWNGGPPLTADTATINSGTVTFAVNDTYGNAATLSSAAITANTGGTLASGGRFNTLWNLTLGGGTLLSNGGVTSDFGTYNLAGTVTASGGVTSTISNGTGSNNIINLGHGSSSAVTNTTFNVGAAGTLNVGTILQNHRYFTTSVQVSVAGLIKTGAGTMNLSAVNTYSGNTTVSEGTLTFSGSGRLDNFSANTVSVASGAQIIASSTTNNVLSFGANRTWDISGTFNSSGGGAQTMPGTVNLNNGTLSGAANGTFGTYLGHNGYTVTINANGASNTINAGNFGIGAGHVIVLNTSLVADALSISTPLGLVGQTGTVTKSGLGTVTLSGTNLYTGATNVNAGTLIVNGSISTSSLTTVLANATLGGSGTLGNTVISGIHSPGNSPGIISHGNLTYESGASVLWELTGNTNTGRGTDYDGINVTGVLTFNGATTLSLDFQHTPAGTVEWNDAFWDLNYTGTNGWLVYDGANPIVGFDNLTLNAPLNWLDQNGDTLTSSRPTGNFFLFHDTTNNDIYLNFVPEPSTTLLGGLGLLALLRRRR